MILQEYNLLLYTEMSKLGKLSGQWQPCILQAGRLHKFPTPCHLSRLSFRIFLVAKMKAPFCAHCCTRSHELNYQGLATIFKPAHPSIFKLIRHLAGQPVPSHLLFLSPKVLDVVALIARTYMTRDVVSSICPEPRVEAKRSHDSNAARCHPFSIKC